MSYVLVPFGSLMHQTYLLLRCRLEGDAISTPKFSQEAVLEGNSVCVVASGLNMD